MRTSAHYQCPTCLATKEIRYTLLDGKRPSPPFPPFVPCAYRGCSDYALPYLAEAKDLQAKPR